VRAEPGFPFFLFSLFFSRFPLFFHVKLVLLIFLFLSFQVDALSDRVTFQPSSLLQDPAFSLNRHVARISASSLFL
jgi:hypothetical protein